MSIIRLKETESTNLYAKEHLSELSDRTVVIAERQTHGRGRFERTWIDLGDDNLFMTVVLKPCDVFSEVYPNLTQYLSLCVCKVLESYGLNPKIKWPNDVLIDGKKICGILSETVTQGEKLKGIVLGIGVNLNSSEESLSKIVDKEATALNIELGEKHIDIDLFTEKLKDEFFRFYDEFLKLGFVMIKDEYVKRAYFLKKDISVRVFNEIKSGIADYITDSGELILKKNDKKTVLTMGDIL